MIIFVSVSSTPLNLHYTIYIYVNMYTDVSKGIGDVPLIVQNGV